MNPIEFRRPILIATIVAMCCSSLYAQHRKPGTTHRNDSIAMQIRSMAAESDTVMSNLLNRIEYANLRIHQINNLLKRNIDTFDIAAGLPEVLDQLTIVRENLDLNRTTPNLRNLNISRVTLLQLEQQLNDWQSRLSRYNERLINSDIELYEFWHDSTFRKPPADTMLKRLVQEQLLSLAPKLISVRKLSQKSLSAIGSLQTRVTRESLTVEEMLDEVDYGIRRGHKEFTRREVSDFWSPDTSALPEKAFSETIQLSKHRNSKVLQLYLQHHWMSILLALLIMAGYYTWLKLTVRRIRNNHISYESILSQVRFAAPRSMLAAVVVAISIAPYLSPGPPMVYVEIWWFALMVSIGLLVRSLWPAQLHAAWLLFFGIFLVYCLLNLLVESTYVENRLYFLFGIISIACGGALLYVIHRVSFHFPAIFKPLVYVFIVAHLLALLFLLTGRVSLAKIIATSAVFNFMLAVNLYIVAEILTETLYLQMESTKSNDAWRALFDLQDAQKQFRTAFWWAASFFWSVALINNLTFLSVVNTEFKTFFSTERHLGDWTFTFGSIGLFVLIIWLTNLLARLLVSFFGGVNRQFIGAQKSKLGTSMLLVRLGLLAGGFLLAVAASGIPLDNIAIIVGALGVGIGFGLQNIVNNLVSGIILAFEKPIQVGDIIEVGTRTGIVKEIGIRASKLSTYDGSDVIIPNGDLISQHLINWTMSNRSRRVEIYVGVAYGSDLEKARMVITQALHEQKDILTYPAPLVLVDSLADNAVNIRVLFWPTDIEKIPLLRSSVVTDIHDGLREAGIEIPFPQRDLHIRSVAPEFAEQLTRDKTVEKPGEKPEDVNSE